eukprot:4045015-Pleurochrysis_carterae.AAC.9
MPRAFAPTSVSSFSLLRRAHFPASAANSRWRRDLRAPPWGSGRPRPGVLESVSIENPHPGGRGKPRSPLPQPPTFQPTSPPHLPPHYPAAPILSPLQQPVGKDKGTGYRAGRGRGRSDAASQPF